MNNDRLELKVGRVYRGKRPRGIGLFPPLCDDRQIIHIGLDTIQYDSPSVSGGRHYPKVSRERFEKWASHDVTDQLPKGEWVNYPPPDNKEDTK